LNLIPTIILYINDQVMHLNMIIEILTIGTIVTFCGLLTWAAMKKYQPKIEVRLNEIKDHNTELKITERKRR
jgi:hypothetical protein